MGTTAIASHLLITNQTFIGLVPRNDSINSRFLYWALQGARDILTATATGAIQQYLSRDDFRRLRIPVPSSPLQRAIADYLDRETARIDALITKKQRMIELLKERRQVLITSAVTDRSLSQGSGVKCAQLRRIFRVVNGGTPTSDPRNWGGGVAWATPVDLARVNGGRIHDTDRNLTAGGLKNGSRLIPAASLIVSTRAPIGYVVECSIPMSFNQGCRGLVARGKVDIRYYRYQLLALVERLEALGQGSTFVELSGDALSAVDIAAPAFEVQRSIADYLDHETARIDAITVTLERQIELLRERRQALITAAVTGELEVSGVTA
jgi:type I restriction enzyme S subunit